jgi:hypothetical protein
MLKLQHETQFIFSTHSIQEGAYLTQIGFMNRTGGITGILTKVSNSKDIHQYRNIKEKTLSSTTTQQNF